MFFKNLNKKIKNGFLHFIDRTTFGVIWNLTSPYKKRSFKNSKLYL